MKLLNFAADVFFPRRCLYCNDVIGFLPRCEKCAEPIKYITRVFSNEINKANTELKFVNKAYALYSYDEPVRSAILQMKFFSRAEKAAQFGKLLGEQINACKNMEMFDIILPIPSTKKAELKRGYNIPQLLAEFVSKETKIPCCFKLLKKDFETKQQSTLTGDQRRGNLAGAFSVKNSEILKGKSVLLIDDVITTGTTVNECAKVLLYAGAKTVSAVCIAISEHE